MDNATDPTKNVRERLTALNTKAYYLLVALSFLYSKNATLSLKVALTLTAVVAVLAGQDYFKSGLWLNRARWFKVALLTVAFISTLWWAWFSHVTSVAAGQKAAQAQTTEQQRPKEPATDLESRLKAAEEKADRALMEKEYIERSQKEAKDYYEKAFDTQVKFLGWLIILIAAVPLVVGLFGFRIVDRTIKHAVSEASTQLEARFDRKLADELQNLRDSNTTQIKELRDALQTQVTRLGDDLSLHGSYNYYFLQGLALAAHENYRVALGMFRSALQSYKSGKSRDVFDSSLGKNTLHDLFVTLERLYGDNISAEAEKELADELYNDLEDELNATAVQFEWFAPLVRDRKAAPPSSQPPTPAADPATPRKSSAPLPDKTRPTKPE